MKTFLKNNIAIFVICISVLIVAILGSVFVNLGMDWYNTLEKPSQWIPNFIIPIVWTIIYLLFIVILSIFNKNKLLNNKIIIYCVLNAIFNILWCLIFFTLNQLLIGNIIIILNLFAGTVLIFLLNKTNKFYIYFLYLYPIWLAIATSLNFALWIIN